MNNIPWSAAELDALREGISDKDFWARFGTGRTGNALRQRRHKLGVSPWLVTQTLNDVQQTGDTVELDPDDVAEWINHLVDPGVDPVEARRRLFQFNYAASAQAQSLQPGTQRVITKVFDERLPIATVTTSDWHVGADFVDTARIERHMREIADADGVWLIGNGDYAEGITKHSKAIGALFAVGAVADRGIQNDRALDCAMAAHGKWLVIADGNHDGWIQKEGGINSTADFARKLDTDFFRESGGTLKLVVNGISYVVAVKHNFRGNSRINTTNPQRTMFAQWPEWENCDVIQLGHLHFNDQHIAPQKGSHCIYQRTGTYKVHDSYSRDLGYAPEWGVAVNVFYPDRKHIKPLMCKTDQDLADALEYVAWQREKYRTGRTYRTGE